jgi:hypothetical protein
VLRPLALLAALLSLALAASAQAADPVTNPNDSGPGSLRNALMTANDGDTIAIPPGTYSLTSGQLVVSNDITLRNQPNADKPLIQSTGNFRVLCVAGPNDVTLNGLIIHNGRAAPGPSGGGCAGNEGGGINAEDANGRLDVQNSIVQHNSASPAQGGGGGIFAAGDLFISDSIVRHNTTTAGLALGNNNGGGGIRWSASGTFSITNSTVYENTATTGGANSGGAGIYSGNAVALTNVTVSGNNHVAAAGATGGGGGGILVQTGIASSEHVTFVGNHSDRGGGAASAIAGAQNSLANSLFHANTATSGADCAGAANSVQGNLTSAGSPTCGFGTGDQAGADPRLGPLAVNGANNGTLTHAILARDSPAVNFGKNCFSNSPPTDQRGVGRYDDDDNGNPDPEDDCDSGAYEFDGNTTADVPDCSPTGVIPLALDSAPGGAVIGLSYRMNGGPEIDQNTGESGQPLTPTSVTFQEGRGTLEYWGRWTNGIQQGHGFQDVLVDKTRPTVDVQQPDGESIFVITRRETVNVQAADALSGLVQDPSGTGVRVNTGRRGAATFAPTATDLCENQASDAFNYRVLAPGLGVRTVLERVRGRVRVRNRRAGGAQASQKGTAFTPLRQPREVPVASFIDARRGTTRMTSARTRREDQIQDGLFSKGVFQVLQSRRARARGLTDVRLKGGSFARCARAGKAGGARAAGVSRRVIRRLRGNARGRFRTTGRNSSATVRGTIWEMVDRCDGTLTRVTRGRVVVRDFRLKKTVVVRAGKSYLARSGR